MTDPLFRDDAYLRECSAEVVRVDGSGVVLSRTVFYAQGGGQPGDTGKLVWEGAEAQVLDTVKAEDGILHQLAEDAPRPRPGSTVTAVLDWERRYGHMRCHTALHLLSVVIPLPVTGGSIGAEKGRLDFDMPDAPEDKETLESRLNALIVEDHPVRSEWITEAELEANPGLVKTMAVKPPTGSGRVRLIRIGTGQPAVDLQPCGGTHVASTSEIGTVKLGKVEKKGKQNRRVSVILN